MTHAADTSPAARPKRVLYLVHHRPGRSPGQRFRCEQYLGWLQANGYQVTFSNMLGEWDDRHFYAYGHYAAKALVVAKSALRRLRDVLRSRSYDAVFVYREAFMLGTTAFERAIRRRGVPLILDFDDSIWLNDTSQGNYRLRWMKRPRKTFDLCRLATQVIVGNAYLADAARRYCQRVEIFPTTIDTGYHRPAAGRSQADATPERPVTIGWTGSRTTLKHLETLHPVLAQLRREYGQGVRFDVIADLPPREPVDGMRHIPWSADDEIARLAAFDIGVMPLPDNEWTRGKCGFKGLQYMAMGVATVMSPVGVNRDIIDHGRNGLLASTPDEWLQALRSLIGDAALRRRLGDEGRKTIEQRYSIEANKERYLRIFDSVTNR